MALRCAPLLVDLHGPAGSRGDLSRPGSGVLGVLFGGRWCQPCAEFVALLKNCYQQVRGRSEQFEVVYASADKTLEDFDAMVDQMPWWRIGYSNQSTLHKIRCLFKISEMPSLVLLDMATGHTILSNACHWVRQCPDGSGFPWQPAPYKQLMMADSLLDEDGEICSYERIGRSYKALYFAANWCPPCKTFGAELRQAVDSVAAAGHRLSVILVSSDRSEESFRQQRAAARWLAVPYGQQARRRELAERFGVRTIPSLVLLDERDRLVCRSAQRHVSGAETPQAFPWRPDPVQELSEEHRYLLDEPLVILFVDADPDEMRFGREVLTPAAEANLSLTADNDQPIPFFIATGSEVAEQVRETACVDDTVPQLVIVDLTLGHRFVLDEEVPVTVPNVSEFFQRWRRRQLTPETFDAP